MSTEPTYYYVKGEGWVPRPQACVFAITTDRLGISVTVLLKDAPDVGDRFFKLHKKGNGEFYAKDGGPNVARIIKHVNGYPYTAFSTWIESFPVQEHYYYFIVVPA